MSKLLMLFAALIFALSWTSEAGAAPKKARQTVKQILKQAPGGGVKIKDGAITATCELSDLQGDVYKSARIVATNNVDHLIKCNFACDISRKGAGAYNMRCTLSIPGRTTSMCGGDVSFHDYQAITGGGYSCD